MKALSFTIFLSFMVIGSLFSNVQKITFDYGKQESAFKQAMGTFMVLQDCYLEQYQQADCDHEKQLFSLYQLNQSIYKSCQAFAALKNAYNTPMACGQITMASLVGVPGFANLDQLNVCSVPDTLALLIYNDGTNTATNIQLQLDFDPGLSYGGFGYSKNNSATVTPFNVSDPTRPIFNISNMAPNSAVIAYIAVKANCDVDISGQAISLDANVNYLSGGMTCQETLQNVGEYNSAIKVPVLNLLSVTPPTRNITNSTGSFCQDIVISQDGIDSKLNSYTFEIDGIDLTGNLSLFTLTANGTTLPFTYNPTTQKVTATVNASYFISNTGIGANNNNVFDEDERMTIRACYKAAACLNGSEFLKYKAWYGCDNKLCFDITEKAAALAFQPNYNATPIATTSNITYGGICGNNLSFDVRVRSANTNPVDGLWEDVFLKIKACIGGNLSVASVKINGQVLSASVFSVLPGGSIQVDLRQLTYDIDGAGVGLSDNDGDGKFDDLRGEQSITFNVEIDISCASDLKCQSLGCSITQLDVNGKRNCGQAFQQIVSLSTPISFSYGNTGVTTNAVSTPGYGIPITEVMQTTANVWLPTVKGYRFGYTFASNNITPCASPGNAYLKVVIDAPGNRGSDMRYLANSATYQGMPVSGVTTEYRIQDQDTFGIVLKIPAGDINATMDDYYFNLEYRGDCYPADYILLSYQVIEECNSCTGVNPCEIIRACGSAATYVVWRGSSCPCKLRPFISEQYRTNYGYADKSLTQPLTRAQVPAVDQRRYLPGDTMYVKVAYEILDKSAVEEGDALWTMRFWPRYTGNGPVRPDITQAKFEGWSFFDRSANTETPIGFPAHLVPYPDATRDNYLFPSMHFINAGVESSTVESRALQTVTPQQQASAWGVCPNNPKINPLFPASSAANYQMQNISCNEQHSDLVYVELWFQVPEACQNGVPSYYNAGAQDGFNNTHQEFLDQYPIDNNDIIYLEFKIPMMENPNYSLALLNNQPVNNTNTIYADMFTYTIPPSTCTLTNLYGSCGPSQPYEGWVPGPVAITNDVSIQDCDVDVNYTFSLTNPVPTVAAGVTPWYANEYRPFMATEYLELKFPNNMVFSNNDAKIRLPDGSEVPLPSQYIDPSYGNLQCLTADCCVSADTTALAALRINDADFYKAKLVPYSAGPNSSSETGNKCDFYAFVHVPNDPFPFLPVGGSQTCTYGINYKLKPICPEMVSSTDFQLEYQFSNPYLPTLPASGTAFASCGPCRTTPVTEFCGYEHVTRYPINPYGANCNQYPAVLDPTGCLRYFENIVPHPEVSPGSINPNRQTGSTFTTPDNFIDNSLDYPSLMTDDQNFRLLLPDLENQNESNTYTVCAGDASGGGATHENVVTSIKVPSAVDFIGVMDANTMAALPFTLVLTNPDSKIYSVLMPDLAPSQCASIIIKTELLFCPVGLNIDTKICVNTASGCLDPAKSSLLLALGSTTCNQIESCYQYISEESEIQVEWDPNPPNEVSLCDEIDLGVRIKNVKPSLLVNIGTNFWLPSGLEFIPGSWTACFPGGPSNTGPAYSIPDPTPDPSKNSPRGTYFTYTSSQLWSNEIYLNGLKSITASQDSNKVTLKFKARMVCDDFVSGTSPWFQATAADPCENTVISQLTKSEEIIVKNANPINFAQFFVLAAPMQFNCGVQDTMELTYLNISPIGVTNNTNMCIKLDPGAFNYVPGSVCFLSPSNYVPIFTETTTGNIVEICMTVPDNIGPGQAFKVGVKIEMSENVDCGDTELGVEVSSVIMDQGCANQGVNCDVNVLNSVNPLIDIAFLPPVAIANHSLTQDCDSDPNNVTLRYTVGFNNGGDSYNNNIEFALIRDLNGNGMRDAFDPVLVTQTQNLNIPMGQMGQLTGNFTIPNGVSCPVFLCVIQETNCVCDNQDFLYTNIEPSFSKDLNRRVVLCPGEPLGLDICDGFTISVIPTEGATLVYTPGNDSLYINLNEGYGVSSPVRLRVTSQLGACAARTYETELFRLSGFELGPFDLVNVCTDNCKRLDLLIPSQYRNSVSAIWTPSTFLDDPTSIRPLICNPTQDITYTVSLTFTDNGQTCNFSAQYPTKHINLQSTIQEGTIVCYDNGTPKISDNKIRFSVVATGGSGTFNVTVDRGTTVSPNTMTAGVPTLFTLGSGSAGSGSPFTITLTDPVAPECPKIFQVEDPGNCSSSQQECQPVKCGTATKQVNGN